MSKGLWVKVAVNFPRHPKLNQLADSLGVSRVDAMGRMLLLWIWALEFYSDGQLPRKPEKIAEAMDWKGDADALVEALLEGGFLEEDFQVHDWLEFSGVLEENRKSNKERQRARREKQKANSEQMNETSATNCDCHKPESVTVTNQNCDCHKTENVTVTKCHAVTKRDCHGLEERREEKNRVEKNREEEEEPTRRLRDASTTATSEEVQLELETLEPSEKKNAEDKKDNLPAEKIRELWNSKATKLRQCMGFEGKRRVQLSARWAEHPSLDFWTDLFQRVNDSTFLTGENNKNWKATIDWVLNPANLCKILEGNYDPRTKPVDDFDYSGWEGEVFTGSREDIPNFDDEEFMSKGGNRLCGKSPTSARSLEAKAELHL